MSYVALVGPFVNTEFPVAGRCGRAQLRRRGRGSPPSLLMAPPLSAISSFPPPTPQCLMFLGLGTRSVLRSRLVSPRFGLVSSRPAPSPRFPSEPVRVLSSPSRSPRGTACLRISHSNARDRPRNSVQLLRLACVTRSRSSCVCALARSWLV
jgi:hypothetical protein